MEGARIGIQYETSFAGKTEVTKFHSFPEVQLSVSEQKIKLKTVFEVVVLYYHFFSSLSSIISYSAYCLLRT